MSIMIKTIASSQCLEIRSLVLRNGLETAKCKIPGDDLESSFHLGAFFNDKLVGISCFVLENDPELGPTKMYRLRGMASLPEAKGKGAGRALLNEAVVRASKLEASHIWCNARELAFGFYEKLNFEYYSEMFDIEGIGPHKKMFRKI